MKRILGLSRPLATDAPSNTSALSSPKSLWDTLKRLLSARFYGSEHAPQQAWKTLQQWEHDNTRWSRRVRILLSLHLVLLFCILTPLLYSLHTLERDTRHLETHADFQAWLHPLMNSLAADAKAIHRLTAPIQPLPVPQSLHEALAALHKLTTLSGLEHAVFVPEAETILRSSNQIRLTGQLSGTVEQIRQCILLLSEQTWIVRLESLTLTDTVSAARRDRAAATEPQTPPAVFDNRFSGNSSSGDSLFSKKLSGDSVSDTRLSGNNLSDFAAHPAASQDVTTQDVTAQDVTTDSLTPNTSAPNRVPSLTTPLTATLPATLRLWVTFTPAISTSTP